MYTSPGYSGTEIWGKIVPPHPLLGYGLALEEHNLLTLITYSQTAEEPDVVSLYLTFTHFPSGAPHPEATKPTILIHKAPIGSRPPSSSVEVHGNTLLLTLAYRDAHPEGLDTLYVFDWKAGNKLQLPFSTSTYITSPGLAFITPCFVGIPNSAQCSLDLLLVPPDIENACLEHSFQLPPIRDGLTISYFRCRAAPALRPDTAYTSPSTPAFLADPSTSLILFILEVEEGPERPYQYYLVIDRHAFLQNLRIPLSSGVAHNRIPWSEWGPSCARWLPGSNLGVHSAAFAYGSKLVSIHRDAATDGKGSPIRILDFNLQRVKDAMAAGPRSSTSGAFVRPCYANIGSFARSAAGSALTAQDEGQELDARLQPPDGPFTERVESALPYVEIFSGTYHDYDGVEMNNESIIGTKMVDGKASSLEVLYFG
ncbi:hypothetical protein MKEN_01341400 [Mycena kentingensis (nom. inval.)]|nr:hypothetical protein MKEN_01341400 [Mycena kentingensis (nom. inval.)]